MKEPWASGYTVGNLIWDPIALHNNNDYLQFHSSNNEAKTLQQLVHKLRSSIEKVDGEFMGRLEGGAGREEHMRNEEMRRKMMAAGAQSGSKVMHFVVSSVIRLGLYDVDFGWGNPVWVSMARFADNINNLVALMDSPTGYGVEAWIALHEQEMTLLKHDNEFLDYAKSTPNIHYNTYLSKLNQYSFK
ncbi:unnamed protein product [Linum trigynum]|uniref:Uncharacterized protein n=1 Tax=Linum trigynum TaxID=586398 RepID=A0AAV2CYS5_9ROSI